MDEVMQENPIHFMSDEQLVSAMTLARDGGDNDKFVELRHEVMYRLQVAHIEKWTKPRRLY